MNQTPLHSEITRTVNDITKIKDALLISLLFIALCWMVFLMDEFLGYPLKAYGLRPRAWQGLRGIITVHFLHGDWKHITQNSLGILVLNSFLFYFYRPIAWKTFLRILLISPILLWVVGRDSNHIGASVLLYGEFAFLSVSGMIRRNPLLMRVSLVVILYYGSLVWYLFPVDSKISWEGHGCGFLVGVILAFLYRHQGPQRRKYQFELEPELPDDDNAYWKINPNDSIHTPSSEQSSESQMNRNQTNVPPEHTPRTTVSVRYHYKPSSTDNQRTSREK